MSCMGGKKKKEWSALPQKTMTATLFSCSSKRWKDHMTEIRKEKLLNMDLLKEELEDNEN